MRFADIDKCDLCNGLDIGMSLYVQGCNAHCENCFNPETWDFDGGKPWTEQEEREFFELASRPYIHRVTILGGEPLAPQNVSKVSQLAQKLKEKFPNKSLWIYSGYTYEAIEERCHAHTEEAAFLRTIMATADYLVDGPYVDSLHDSTITFRGSANQRIIGLNIMEETI